MQTLLSGLSEKQAQELLLKEGYNRLPHQKRQNFWDILLNVVKEPMLFLLLITGTIYLLLGEKQDALMLLTFIFVVIGITFYQERKTERALDALKNLSSPRALVLRDGQEKVIPGSEVVRGDIVILCEGDRIPADGVVMVGTNLLVDESLLTGESLPVRKIIWDQKAKLTQPGGEDQPFVFSGTMIVQGRATIQIISIGINTELGKIGKSLEEIKEEDTLLKKETNRIIKEFALVGLFLCLIVVGVYGLAKGQWLNGFLAGLTLSMSMLPEEFSVVLVIFLSLGAWRMSKYKVLTRNTASIETLGAATALCVDKTGTLTLNKMRLDALMVSSQFLEIEKLSSLPQPGLKLLEYSILASQDNPFDPIEKEIEAKAKELLAKTNYLHADWKLIKEYPLTRELLALSHVWQTESNYVIAAKGAPEAIASLCHFSQEQTQTMLVDVASMAQKGFRVLGVAKAISDNKELPVSQQHFIYEFLGLLGFTDPVRPGTQKAVQECYDAGIKVVMITGDYPGTAQFVARQIGLKNPDKFITGMELQKIDSAQLKEKIKDINIFARVVPEQKLAIINALKANNEIVAMTGDGVNDAPALKAAHIGIAMGERGTDVAREASDIVLLNDDFTSIVEGVRMGRRIFDNLKKAVAYIFSVHIPIAGMTLLPILMNSPILLWPAHIAFLELIIDPSCSIVFESEKEEKNIMKRPPRNLKQPLFDKKVLTLGLFQGLSVLMVSLAVYLVALKSGLNENGVRALSFSTIVFGNIILIITNLSHNVNFLAILRNKNKALLWVLTGTITCLLVIIYNPFFRSIFHFSKIHWQDLFLAFLAACASLSWFEIYKTISSRKAIIK